MNNIILAAKESNPQTHLRMSPHAYEGIYHSITVNKPSSEIYAFCQNEANLRRVLQDLPEKMKNFLDLELINTNNNETARVSWQNKKDADMQGTLTFILSPSSQGKGTVLIANALFGDYSMDDQEPSDLINIFLKRMKALAETGQLATTKGQPNGKDEKEINETLKH